MFAGDRALMLLHRLRHRIGDRSVLIAPFQRLQIDQRANMQAAGAGVGVDGVSGVVVVDDALDIADVIGQAFDRHGAVFNEGDRLGFAAFAHHQAQPGFAHGPDIVLLRRRFGDRQRAIETQPRQVRLEIFNPGIQLAHRPDELDHQNRFRIALDEGQAVAVAGGFARLVQQELVHQLNGGRLKLENARRRLERSAQRVEMRQRQPGILNLRPLNQAKLGAHHCRQRALGAAEQPIQIDVVRVDLVQRVTSHRAPGLGIARFNQGLVLGNQVADSRADALQLRGRFIQPDQVAARRHHLQARYMIGRHAVADAVGTGGVIADDAADGRAFGAGRVGTEHQIQRRQLRVERSEDHARLDIDRARLGIDAPNAAHAPGEIHDDRFADRLASQSAATPARQQRRAIFARDLVHGDHIIGITREGDRQRHDLIIAGIGAVERARHAVGGRLILSDGVA